MNNVIGYALVALALINLIGLLLVFRRLGTVARTTATPPPVALSESAPMPTPDVAPAIDPEALAAVLRRMDSRLGDIEDQMHRPSAFSAANEAGGHSDKALALAQRLARQGASPQDIADTCGISLTEAELLHRLHATR